MVKELIDRRTRNSKTFDLGKGKYALDATIGALHYKEKPNDPESPWVDIDTTIIDGKVRKAPFDLDIFLQGIPGFHYKSKESGQFIVRLKAGRQDKGKSDIPPGLIQPRIEGNKVIWENIYPDTDVILEVQNTQVHLKRLIKSANAPLEFDVDIEEVQVGIAKLRPLQPATDANGQQLVMEEEKLPKGRRERLKFEVIAEEEAQPITYPILDNTTVDETVQASTDDCYRKLYTSSWSLTTGSAYAGAFSSTNYQRGGGYRFITVAVPQGAIIESPTYLTFRAKYARAGTVVRTRISAEDVDDAPTFADDAGAFDTRWANRTTARVDWDNIPAWTAEADYNSPDIASVIQEIVNRGSWASGNDLVIFWEDFEDRSDHNANAMRQAYSYDGDTTYCARLHIEYTAVSAPTVTAQAVTDKKSTSATGNGTITDNGGEDCSKRGVCWNTIGNPTVADDKSEETDSFGMGAFARPMTGLSPGTHYYVKAYAYNSAGYGYSSQVEFDTPELYTKTVDIDALLKEIDTKTVDVDAYIKAIDAKTADLDILLRELGITETVNLDALLAAINQTKTVDLDALLAALGITKTVALDIFLKAIDTKTVNLDTLIKELGLTKTVALDVILGKFYKDVDLDVLLRDTDTKTVAIDILIRKLGVTETVDLDALLALVKLTQTVDVDILLEKTDSKTINLDIYLRALDVISTVDLDVLIRELGITKTVALDVLLRQVRWEYVDLDVLIRALGVTKTVALDVILGGMSCVTISLDVILLKPLAPALVYTIEIRNSDGELIAILERVHGIGYSQLVNAPHVLRFALPATDNKVSNIILANEFWLRDNRTNTVVRKFKLQRKTDIRQ